jgi:hypothetical protein
MKSKFRNIFLSIFVSLYIDAYPSYPKFKLKTIKGDIEAVNNIKESKIFEKAFNSLDAF